MNSQVITLLFLVLYQPRIDEKHSRWLHLRIRPSTLPFLDPAKHGTPLKLKTKPFVDGRWILAFQDEDTCKSALSIILEEINLQSSEVERRLKPLVDLERPLDSSDEINLQSKDVERRLKPLVDFERAVDSSDTSLCSTKSLTSTNSIPNLL